MEKNKNNDSKVTEENIAELLKSYLTELKSNLDDDNKSINPTLPSITKGLIHIPIPSEPITEEQFNAEIMTTLMKHHERLIRNNIDGKNEPEISKEEFSAILKKQGLEVINNKIFSLRENSKPENNTDNKPKNG